MIGDGPLTGGGGVDRVEYMEMPGESAGDAVLRLTGDIDALTQAGYRDQAAELIATAAPSRLIVDMTNLATIDSSGLGLLVHLHSLALDRDIAMVLTNVPPRATALLKRTGLDRVFAIESR